MRHRHRPSRSPHTRLGADYAYGLRHRSRKGHNVVGLSMRIPIASLRGGVDCQTRKARINRGVKLGGRERVRVCRDARFVAPLETACIPSTWREVCSGTLGTVQCADRARNKHATAAASVHARSAIHCNERISEILECREINCRRSCGVPFARTVWRS